MVMWRIAIAGAVVMGLAVVTYFTLYYKKPEMVDNLPTTVFVESFSLPASPPVQLIIPKLGMEITFSEPIGLHADGTMDIAFNDSGVAYYKHAPTPGEIGPAVVFGHGVFNSLTRLRRGDTITIYRADGTSATFAVSAVEEYHDTVLPTETIYRMVSYAGLRLIPTTQDKVVYATLIATSSIDRQRE